MSEEYTVRESARAKSVRLCVTAEDGLVVVVPSGFDQRRIPGLLRAKETWVHEALREVQRQRALMPPPEERPDVIDLRAIDCCWRVFWSLTEDDRVRLTQRDPDILNIRGPIHDTSAWQDALKRWLIEQARMHLTPWLRSLSSEVGMTSTRTIIRCQKTRWGSYSTRGTISLNAQLLFLPGEWVRYVLLHELCHIQHPNHSQEFWRLLIQHEPNATRLRADMRHARRRIPSWLR